MSRPDATEGVRHLLLVCYQCRALSHPLDAEWLDAVSVIVTWSWACEHVPEHLCIVDMSAWLSRHEGSAS
jgi:hypothetical protein